MTDLLRTGVEWLREQAGEHMASEITYRAPEVEVTLRATMGRTEYEVADDAGRTVQAHVVDFLVAAGDMTFDPAPGDTVTIVVDPVTTQITVKDSDDVAIATAQVLVEAQDGTDDLPFEETVTITSVTTTASVSHTAHGMINGDKVTIRWAAETEYNGIFVISNVTTNAYDYTMLADPPGSTATIASGRAAITATGVVVAGATNGSGIVSASRTFTVDQAVRMRVAKSGYKAVPTESAWVNDVVDNVNGLSKTIQLQDD